MSPSVDCASCGRFGPPGIGWISDAGSEPKAGLWCKGCGRGLEPKWIGMSLLEAIRLTPVQQIWPSWRDRRLEAGLDPDEPEDKPLSVEEVDPETYQDEAPPPPSITASVEAVRSWLASRIGKGVDCPACGRFTKLYLRHLNFGMAKALLVICRLSKEAGDAEGWVGVGKKHMAKGYALDLQHAEYSKLKHWGLIEEKTRGSKEGLWRPTRLGLDFAAGKIKVPECAVLKHNRKVGTGGAEISIDEAIKGKFDKAALFSGSAEAAVIASTLTSTTERDVATMSMAEVDAELTNMGIDVGPALEKVRAAVAAARTAPTGPGS